MKFLVVLGIFLLSVLSLFLLFGIFTMVCSLFVRNKEYAKHSSFYRFLLHFWSVWLIKVLRIKLEIKGMENIPENTRFLLVGNHRSNYDPIITWVVFKKYDIAYITKPNNFKVPWFGKFIRKCCFLGIDRNNAKSSMKTLNKAAKLMLNDTVSIGIYPEGTRSKKVEMGEFHNGVFKIAQKADAPIVIASIQRTEDIFKNIPFRGTKVKLHILETISKEDVSVLSTEEIGNIVKNRLNDDFDK